MHEDTDEIIIPAPIGSLYSQTFLLFNSHLSNKSFHAVIGLVSGIVSLHLFFSQKYCLTHVFIFLTHTLVVLYDGLYRSTDGLLSLPALLTMMRYTSRSPLAPFNSLPSWWWIQSKATCSRPQGEICKY